MDVEDVISFLKNNTSHPWVEPKAEAGDKKDADL